MSKENEINNKLKEIWDESFKDKLTSEELYVPEFLDTLKKNCILFVGMNPSFNEGSIHSMFKDLKIDIECPKEYFLYKNFDNFKIEDSCALTKKARAVYPYFTPFKNIAKYVEYSDNWESIDLFHFRQTNQKDFLGKVYENGEFTSYAKSEISIFKDLVEYIDPVCIIVANAKAGDIIKSVYDHMYFDHDLGTYTISINGKETPTFLCSMLSGQRAMDTGSFERLKWHVRNVLKQGKK